jgi:hypothetical protein
VNPHSDHLLLAFGASRQPLCVRLFTLFLILIACFLSHRPEALPEYRSPGSSRSCDGVLAVLCGWDLGSARPLIWNFDQTRPSERWFEV